MDRYRVGVVPAYSTRRNRETMVGRGSSLTAQSALGHALYLHYGLDPQDYETMILLADGVAHFKSEAGIRIAEGLGLPWSLAAAFRILPRGLRDRLYDRIARNRYRLFGKRDRCYVASEADRSRFLAF